jgi:predicted ATPase/DNA-binding winged helix-turn-helix (wHTH) protein
MESSLKFGCIEVRPETRSLLVDGKPAALGARAYDVLLALIEHRQRLLTKDELLELVWPGVIVEENNLQVQISTLRKILGASAIATVPGRGYRFTLGLAAQAPAPPARQILPQTNVAHAFEDLIGREDDIDRVRRSLGQARLTSIVGPGGIGKTRLAQDVARIVDRDYEGRWWVDLVSVDSEEGISRAIASAAGLRLGEDEGSTALARTIGERRMLLVLDNCEHVASVAANVARTLMDQSAACLLATSQVPLKVSGEHVYRLEPLAVPASGADLEGARSSAAFRLLERRATAGSRNYRVTDVPAAIEICARLDGNPLAIEMVASRLPTLGIESVRTRLAERLEWARGAEAASKRQRSLRAALEWSHALLTAEEQAVLRRLSTFAATFSLESAKHVGSEEGWDEWATVDALGNLVDKSLVQVVRLDPPRYRLLETTRLFGLEELARRGEERAARGRHCRAMAFASEDGAEDDELDEDAWLSRLLPDYPDMQAAFEYAVQEGDARHAAPIANALNRIEFLLGVGSAVRRRKKAALGLLPQADAASRAKLWNCLAHLRLNDIDDVTRLEIAQSRVASWRELENTRELYKALAQAALEYATYGRRSEALAALAEAQALENPDWPARQRATLDYYVMGTYVNLGDYAKAQLAAERYIAACSAAGDRRFEAEARSLLADIELLQGRLDLSIATSRAACADLRSLAHKVHLGLALKTLCTALLLKGEIEEGRTAAREALQLLVRNGLGTRLVAQAAFLAVRAGDYRRSAQLLSYSTLSHHRDRSLVDAARSMIEQGLSAEDRLEAEKSGKTLSRDQAERLIAQALGQGASQ